MNPQMYGNAMYPYQNPYLNRMNSPTNPAFAPQNNGILWVQGIEGAKAWQLSPNSNVMLMDSENDGRFYIKVSDNVGMCTLRTFEYREVTEQPKPSNIDLSEYVRRDELQALLTGMLGGNQNEQPLSAAKRGTGTDAENASYGRQSTAGKKHDADV